MNIYYSFFYNEFSYSLFYGESNIKNSKIADYEDRFANVAIVTKQSGTFNAGGYSGSIPNDTRRVIVEFPEPFTKIPTVVCASTKVPGFKYTYEEITYSYFVVNVIYPGGAGVSDGTVTWVAETVQ